MVRRLAIRLRQPVVTDLHRRWLGTAADGSTCCGRDLRSLRDRPGGDESASNIVHLKQIRWTRLSFAGKSVCMGRMRRALPGPWRCPSIAAGAGGSILWARERIGFLKETSARRGGGAGARTQPSLPGHGFRGVGPGREGDRRFRPGIVPGGPRRQCGPGSPDRIMCLRGFEEPPRARVLPYRWATSRKPRPTQIHGSKVSGALEDGAFRERLGGSALRRDEAELARQRLDSRWPSWNRCWIDADGNLIGSKPHCSGWQAVCRNGAVDLKAWFMPCMRPVNGEFAVLPDRIRAALANWSLDESRLDVFSEELR
jgi:hypothetical protein